MKKNLLISKRSSESIGTEEVIFIILNLAFFAMLLFFVIRSSSVDTILEEVYAKKIALVLDSMQPGMEVTLAAESFFKQIEQNKFNEFPIKTENNKVFVKTSSKISGYSFVYFSEINPTFYLDNQLKTITIKS